MYSEIITIQNREILKIGTYKWNNLNYKVCKFLITD